MRTRFSGYAVLYNTVFIFLGISPVNCIGLSTYAVLYGICVPRYLSRKQYWIFERRDTVRSVVFSVSYGTVFGI